MIDLKMKIESKREKLSVQESLLKIAALSTFCVEQHIYPNYKPKEKIIGKVIGGL